MFFKKKKVIKHGPERVIIRNINNLKKKQLNERTIVELNQIIRDYMRRKFGLAQSLTYEEILRKLEEKKLNKAVKIDISHLLTQIYQKEYFPSIKFDEKEIEYLIGLSIKTLGEIETGKKKKEEVIKEEIIKKSSSVKKIEEDISSLGKNFKLDWKDKKIREKYEKIRKDYSELKESEKIKIYPKIISLFKIENGKK